MIEELEKSLGISIPKDFSSEEANICLKDACEKSGVKYEAARTGRLLDKLADELLAGTCIHPTFIMNQPLIMGHLAKPHRSKEGLSERFELYVNKQELINAYTEQNDPELLKKEFQNVVKDLQTGAQESLDEAFCSALEYGLPPTAGWGMGIDRLVMLITDSVNIKDVLSFPLSNKRRKRGADVPFESDCHGN